MRRASPLLDAVYVFARQKGATEEQFDELAERLRGLPDVPGSGAAGGLGGAFAALGAELVPGARSSCSTSSASTRAATTSS